MRAIVFLMTALVTATVIHSTSAVTLQLRLEWRGETQTRGRVFWSGDAQEFDEKRSVHFNVRPGPQTIVVTIPSAIRWLRLDPVRQPGKIRLLGVRLHSTLLPFDDSEFDGPAALQAWTPGPGVQLIKPRPRPRLASGALELDSVGINPYLISPPLYRFALMRWLQILLMAVIAASAVSAAVPGHDKRRYWLAYGAAAAVVVSAVSFGVSRLWQETRWFSADSRDVSIPGYDLSFYDMWGRPVSTRHGPLAMVIDPFTIYRNYPDQKGDKFNIDANGFRESGPAKPGARAAFVLGGSTTFGLGAPSDEDTFVYRMSAADPSAHYTNAAVVGFQSGQELALMIHHLDAFRPKLYLVVDGWNDVEQNLQDPHGDDLGFNHSTFDLFQDHLFRLASLQASGLPDLRLPVSARGESPGFEEKLIHRYMGNVERMSSFARSRGSGFALAIQPTLGLKRHLSPAEDLRSRGWRDSKPTRRALETYRKLARETLALCARLSVPCIDLNSDPEFTSSSETFFVDDCHFSSQGNRWVAAALGALLKAGRMPGNDKIH